ncbi:hypothetical protein CUC11_04445 [Lacticaseibacillus rhamnosus]|nr:hypothetical protein CUC11_04445 [Lacticaseibacillus rhamnosus]PTR95131.1 hypothetical protein DBP95_13100 [Lacticaseibacillus rhamnosus]PTS01918.1 hypothetical protein DBQ08_12290 [Lacticaseibacillus rhamnosus]
MRGFKARPWSKAEKSTPLKTNFTAEPIAAPPALAFYANNRIGRPITLLLESSKLRGTFICLTRAPRETLMPKNRPDSNNPAGSLPKLISSNDNCTSQ